jgi:prepilin-type N-terminal cleavage/methylation domain-containing protein
MSKIGARGFTLIEVLLVTAIFASIGLAVFNCLSNGLKLWTKSQQLLSEEDAAIFLDRFSVELKNSFLYSKILLKGEETSISLPTVVTTIADRGSSRAHEGYIDQLGSVRYSFDPALGALLREQANYSLATRGDFGPARVDVKGVKELRFRYFFSGSKDPHMSAGGDGLIPSGVEVEIRLLENGEDKVYRRYVPIPVGV